MVSMEAEIFSLTTARGALDQQLTLRTESFSKNTEIMKTEISSLQQKLDDLNDKLSKKDLTLCHTKDENGQKCISFYLYI